MNAKFIRIIAVIALCICMAFAFTACDMLSGITGSTPESSTPESGTPESGTPESGTPGSGTPESGTPESGTPGSGTPESGNPDPENPGTDVPPAEEGPSLPPCPGHSFTLTICSETLLAKESTCTTPREYYYSCEYCYAAGTQTFKSEEPYGHQLLYAEGKPSRCLVQGWNDYEYCSVCDYSTKELLPFAEHEYTHKVVKPTCTEKGYTVHTCIFGESYADTWVDALDHDWDMYVVAPTCTAEGYTASDCTRCDALLKDDVKPALDHNYDEWICTRCSELVSKGLQFTPNGDGTCYLSSVGSCTDSEIYIPGKSPAGHKVTGIGEGAFLGGSWIESISIPSTVDSIHVYVFAPCSSLRSINVSDNNAKYKSVDGVLYSLDLTELIRCPIGKATTKFEIPSGTKKLYADSFGDCTGLLNVVVPDSCTVISRGAFSGCDNLTSITLPNISSYLGEIFGATVFSNHSEFVPLGLSEVKLTGGTSIADYAFYDCAQIASVNIPSTVQSIGKHAFNRTAITSITLPDGVAEIGEYAFSECMNLGTVNIGVNSLLNAFETRVFDRTAISDIYIPNSVQSIKNSAFYGCDKLESVRFGESSQLVLIGDAAFSNCTSLVSIEIPESVESIWRYSFSWCTSLESVSFGEESKLELIAYKAFEYCTSLRSIIIPKNVYEIQESAFVGCSSLESVEFKFANSNTYWRVAESSSSTSWKVIPRDDLSEKSDAADLLAGTYCNYWWQKVN